MHALSLDLVPIMQTTEYVYSQAVWDHNAIPIQLQPWVTNLLTTRKS